MNVSEGSIFQLANDGTRIPPVVVIHPKKVVPELLETKERTEKVTDFI